MNRMRTIGSRKISDTNDRDVIGLAALHYLPWVSCVASISAIMSISTQAPNGTCATLTALREWRPRSHRRCPGAFLPQRMTAHSVERHAGIAACAAKFK
jgi:hypothetical protein